MTQIATRIAANVRSVHDRIAAACDRADRVASDVTLIAVTKYAEPEWVRELVSLGVIELGESRPQQLIERVGDFPTSVHWHLIGHLQRNKARRVLPLTTLIHSVDSLRLLSAIDRLAEELDLRPRVLLEVNVAGETAKHGFDPQQLPTVWDEICAHERVQIEGLMTMAPRESDPENARPVFQRLRELRDELASRSTAPATLPVLSMGMSGDFEIAIEAGATHVRIGSRLYEGLS
ncbi:MAG: YggS family pyridoxal phosphate-dependent enzyme [Planctomycetes bacterium]|nr:YggS family pyridoxal phosphate-dependent enzyme [Planctomycetota bacterium]